MIFLIDLKKNNYKFYIIFFLKTFFLIFLRNYINYNKNSKIEIAEII
jgi:hypothetical protein